MNNRAKTPDGKPTALSSLNIGEEPVKTTGLWSKLKTAYRNLNLIMAGMYTGVGCAGTPHSEHNYEEEDAKDIH